MSVTVSEETVAKVQDSWEIVLQIPDCTQAVGELLFRNIFKLAPGAHKMFPFGKGYEKVEDKMFKTRMFKRHAKNVVSMLDSSVQFLGPDLEELEETLVNLGAQHVGFGILPEHYPIVGQALLDTLAAALSDEFTEDLKESWAGVYGFITTSMLKGANESLLRFSIPLFNPTGNKKEITLDEYVSSMLPGQTALYYITMTNDAFNFKKLEKLKHAQELQKAGVAILYIAKNKQELMANNLQKYLGRKMVDVAGNDVDTSFLKDIDHDDRRQRSVTSLYKREGLAQDAAEDFCEWFQATLGYDKVEACTPTCDFASQPARVIHDEEDPTQVKRLETMDSLQQTKKHVEINPRHPLIVEINKARESHPGLAQVLAAQVYDNCLINAGLLNDFRVMVTRINDLSLALLQEKNKSVITTPVSAQAAPPVDDSKGSMNGSRRSFNGGSRRSLDGSQTHLLLDAVKRSRSKSTADNTETTALNSEEDESSADAAAKPNKPVGDDDDTDYDDLGSDDDTIFSGNEDGSSIYSGEDNLSESNGSMGSVEADDGWED
ncbi:TNF receptor-associated protein 1 homolog, mitochondrial [Seminavis robusta]|uniref:TNF receptor-associated protein 1 homolog, mitochondrial n=1 Tax=Seminavis robusta TaxID=568900 RepID=A0A9N8D4L7_9STRA|nr:TNF receptor-associated protein 1 homolog, mitochondrial [Seminavis robusta]|eukprot:Sro3_g002840.1 TNF receptor-associated protein 1 homolog, mitochondrial (548) ;mRNA; r:254731-256480